MTITEKQTINNVMGQIGSLIITANS